MTQSPQALEKAKRAVKQYQQMNESLITNPEFLEGRIAILIDQARQEGMKEGLLMGAKEAEQINLYIPTAAEMRDEIVMDIRQLANELDQ